MKKALSLLVVLMLVMGICSASVFASVSTIATIEVKLPADMASQAGHGYIYLSKDGSNIIDAKTRADGVVIEFWTNKTNLRVGAKEPTADGTVTGGLQVRKDIPLADIQNNTLKFELKNDDGKWMLYANNIAINDRNWNIATPEGINDAEWKTTDNIMNCTDYGKPSSADGAIALPGENGKIDFFIDNPSTFKITADTSALAFEMVKAEVAQPAAPATTEAAPADTAAPATTEAAPADTAAQTSTEAAPAAETASNPKTGDVSVITLMLAAGLSASAMIIKKKK